MHKQKSAYGIKQQTVKIAALRENTTLDRATSGRQPRDERDKKSD